MTMNYSDQLEHDATRDPDTRPCGNCWHPYHDGICGYVKFCTSFLVFMEPCSCALYRSAGLEDILPCESI